MKTVVLMRVVVDVEAISATPSAVAHALEDALNDRTWKKVAFGTVPLPGNTDDTPRFDDIYVEEAHLVAFYAQDLK